jgi:hypothetical protein
MIKSYPYAAPIGASYLHKQSIQTDIKGATTARRHNRLIEVGFYQKKVWACRGPGAVQDHDMLIAVTTSGW